MREGSYKWSGGKSVTVFDSTIVGVETDSGDVGYGEVCPLGPFYLPAYAEGVRTGLRELAPHLIGCDPRELLKLNQTMDAALKGHPYVKSGIDIACWDILGKTTGLPVCVLMGGRFGESVRLYRAISQELPEQMAANVAKYRAEGYTRFQLKVGGDPDLDIERIRQVRAILLPTDRMVADANTGWTQHEAMRVVRAVRDLDVYIEQAVPDIRGMPFGATAYGPPICTRRERGRNRHAVAGQSRFGHGRRELEDQQAGRSHQNQAGPRPVRFDGDRHDTRRQLGRRYHHGSNRAPRAQHSGTIPIHEHRLQQLCHREHGNRHHYARTAS